MDIGQIYNDAFGISHGAGLSAVWSAACAETNRLRDEAASVVAGVDVSALQAENTALTAQVADLTDKVGALSGQIAGLTPVAPAPVVDPAPVEPVVEPVQGS